MLTLTAPWGRNDVEHAAAFRRHLAVIAAGLRESQGWSRQQAVGYLCDLPGVRPAWTRELLLHVCGRPSD